MIKIIDDIKEIPIHYLLSELDYSGHIKLSSFFLITIHIAFQCIIILNTLCHFG